MKDIKKKISAALSAPNAFFIFFFTLFILLTPIITAVLLGAEINASRYLRYNCMLSLIVSLTCIPEKLNKLLTLPVVFILGFFSLLETGHLLIFKSLTTQNVFFTIFESHLAEGYEFFETYLFSLNGLILFSIFFLWIFFLFTLKKINLRAKKFSAFLIATSLVISLISLPSFFEVSKNIIKYTPLQVFYVFIKYRDEVKGLIKSNLASPPENYLFKDEHSLKENTIVIVLGESTSRNKMSLYGYARNTNPL